MLGMRNRNSCMKILQASLAVFFVCYSLLLFSPVKAEEPSKPTIAVFDFGFADTASKKVTVETQDRERVTKETSVETSLLRDRFITALAKSDRIKVVEREKINQIMEEAKLTQSDLTDPNQAMELGNLLGAEYFLLGTISMLDGSIEREELPYEAGTQTTVEHAAGANIRIVNTETGEIVAAESMQAKSREQSLDSNVSSIGEQFKQQTYDQLVQKMVDSVMSELFPLLVAAYSQGTVYLNQGGLEEGSRKKVVEPGEEIVDPDSGRVLGTTEADVAIVEVVQGLDDVSQAEVVEWLREEQDIPRGAKCRPVSDEKQ